MIETGLTSDFNEDYISINLSDPKHKNRVISLFKSANILDGKFECTIRAQWTDSNFHPHMLVKEEDFLGLVKELNKWADKIKSDRK